MRHGCTGPGKHKDRGIGKPLIRFAGGYHGAADIRTHRLITGEYGIACDDIERVAGLGLEDETDLPPLARAMAFEWQVIDAAQNHAMPRIEVGPAIIAPDIETVLHARCGDAGEGVVVKRFRVGIGGIQLEIVGEALSDRKP